MAITIRKAEVVGKDSDFVQSLIDVLNAPVKGEKNVQTLTYTFDADDPADAKWIERDQRLATQLEQAQSDYADAETAGDDPAMKVASKMIKDATIMRGVLLDTAFGYAERSDGKPTFSKGSFLDRVNNAVKELNKRETWLAGDVIVINGVDLENHKLNVVRQAKSMKRTRILRPTIDSVTASVDAKIDALIPSDTSAE